MNKEYLRAVEKKLKKQGKSDKAVEDYIKKLLKPNKMEEEKKVEESPAEASEPVVEEGEVSATE